jgi:hypothetical protein
MFWFFSQALRVDEEELMVSYLEEGDSTGCSFVSLCLGDVRETGSKFPCRQQGLHGMFIRAS